MVVVMKIPCILELKSLSVICMRMGDPPSNLFAYNHHLGRWPLVLGAPS
jgi:hypothetical protein